MSTRHVSPAARTAIAVLRDGADPEIITAADKAVAAGAATWVHDPEVAGVVGLIQPGTDRAFIIVYVADEDFEFSDEFYARFVC